MDWLLYTFPADLLFAAELPFVSPIFDLQHRLQPEFPEVSAGGEFDRRERMYRRIVRESTLVIADSEVGKEDILEFYSAYGATSDKVKVLPFTPAPYLSAAVPDEMCMRVREQLRLPERYFFYPAQFWPHKNHLRIVQAIGLLKREAGRKIPVVFSGTRGGRLRNHVFREIVHEARALGVSDQVRYLGHVPNELMACMYLMAEGLVMPTFFGPTNIPVVEAWHCGCPVLTSDIRGIREHAGDAALLVDPRSVEALADGMRRLWDDAILRERLVAMGKERLLSNRQIDFRDAVEEIVFEADERVRSQR